MRANIRDIINGTGCSESMAAKVEQYINDNWLINWSECEMSELHKVSKEVLPLIK